MCYDSFRFIMKMLISLFHHFLACKARTQKKKRPVHLTVPIGTKRPRVTTPPVSIIQQTGSKYSASQPYLEIEMAKILRTGWKILKQVSGRSSPAGSKTSNKSQWVWNLQTTRPPCNSKLPNPSPQKVPLRRMEPVKMSTNLVLTRLEGGFKKYTLELKFRKYRKNTRDPKTVTHYYRWRSILKLQKL